MKRVFLNYVAIVAIAVSIGMGLSACSKSNAQGGNSNASTRWEYKAIHIASPYETGIESSFNELGKDGWEYVGGSGAQNQGYAHIFKRRLP